MSDATIIIELVRHNGRLVGRTASDRWNLSVYGVGTLADTRNQAEVKSLRRRAGKDGLSVRVVKGERQAELTQAERHAWARPTDSERDIVVGTMPGGRLSLAITEAVAGRPACRPKPRPADINVGPLDGRWDAGQHHPVPQWPINV